MACNIYSAIGETTAPLIAAAMMRGGFGSDIYYDNIHRPGAWAGFGSPQTWDALSGCIKSGADWYYADHAYFGRKRFYRVTKNAFQHNGEGRPNFNRLLRFHSTAKPFKKDGSYILLCIQSDNYHWRFGDPVEDFQQRMVRKIRLYSDRPIKIRSKKSTIPFDDDLRGAWAVVTYSSACALHALMEGIPAFTSADNCVSSLTLRDPVNIEHPYYPTIDRRNHVAGVLASNQWTLDEITRGLTWRALNEAVR